MATLEELKEVRDQKEQEYLTVLNATTLAGSYRIGIDDTTKTIEQTYEEFVQAEREYKEAKDDTRGVD